MESSRQAHLVDPLEELLPCVDLGSAQFQFGKGGKEVRVVSTFRLQGKIVKKTFLEATSIGQKGRLVTDKGDLYAGTGAGIWKMCSGSQVGGSWSVLHLINIS